MHEYGFDQSFDVVEGMAAARQVDHGVRAGGERLRQSVEKRHPEVEEEVYEKRPCIFCKEDHGPPELRSEVSEV